MSQGIEVELKEMYTGVDTRDLYDNCKNFTPSMPETLEELELDGSGEYYLG